MTIGVASTHGHRPDGGSDKTRDAAASWYGKVNQPLVTGIIILLGTGGIQHCYWVRQQHYLAAQTERVQKEAAISGLTQAVGRMLTADARVVGAHEKRLGVASLNRYVGEYNVAAGVWDSGEEELRRQLRKFFPDPGLQRDFEAIFKSLGDLDTGLDALQEIPPTEQSSKHEDAIRACRQKITAIEQFLRRTTDKLQALSS